MEQSVKILMAGVSMLGPQGEFATHTHPQYQINHVLKGSIACEVDASAFTANVGDTFLIHANMPHSLRNFSEETAYYLEVKFTSFSKTASGILAGIEAHIPHDEFSGSLLKEILDENNNQTPQSAEIMLTYLYAIIYRLSAENRRTKFTPSKYIDVSEYSEPVRDVIRFLENNYQKQITLDDIVADIPFKKSYICSLFKKETTLTIFSCLMIIRVRKAVELLTFSDYPLAQISRETGFINVTHFNRVYTKHCMIPPGQFRKHLKLQDYYWKDAITGKNASPITIAAFENRKIDFSDVSAAIN